MSKVIYRYRGYVVKRDKDLKMWDVYKNSILQFTTTDFDDMIDRIDKKVDNEL